MNEAVVEAVPLTSTARTEGFTELYERTFPRVYAYVASLLRDRSAAEDVTAQAFERAYRKRGSYRPARGSMDAWVFGIARNAALDELRKRKRRAVLEGDPEDVGSPTPEDQADLAVRRETVRAALASLDGQERDLIALEVRRRALQRRDRPRARDVRVQRGHAPASHHHEAERGLP